jgi:regulatory protein
MVNHEWSEVELRVKAEAYCAAAEHCIWDVQQKLMQWNATPQQTENILASLQKNRYIDEQRYCHAFVHDKLLYQGWGRLKMKAHLQAKHLPATAIAEALNQMDEQEYMRILEQVIVSKQRSIKQSDPQAKEKLIRFCLQRGFTYSEILACLNEE